MRPQAELFVEHHGWGGCASGIAELASGIEVADAEADADDLYVVGVLSSELLDFRALSPADPSRRTPKPKHSRHTDCLNHLGESEARSACDIDYRKVRQVGCNRWLGGRGLDGCRRLGSGGQRCQRDAVTVAGSRNLRYFDLAGGERQARGLDPIVTGCRLVAIVNWLGGAGGRYSCGVGGRIELAVCRLKIGDRVDIARRTACRQCQRRGQASYGGPRRELLVGCWTPQKTSDNTPSQV